MRGMEPLAWFHERSILIIFPSVIQRVEDVRLDGRGSQGFTIHVERLNEQNNTWKIVNRGRSGKRRSSCPA